MESNALLKFIPKEVRELFLIKIFSTYSFAILYSSLILYMTKDVGLSNQFATGVTGVFISINFLLHFLGGYAGGKLISNRGLLLLGLIMEFVGVSILSSYLFIGLGIFLTGSGLYVTSVNAIMLQRFDPNDNRREKASFWLYSGMNLGFFIGHTISGYVHVYSNYQWLFFTAVMATIISLFLIGLNWNKFEDRTTELSAISKQKQRRRFLSSLSLIPVILISVICALIYHVQSSKLIMFWGSLIFCSILILAFRQPNEADKKKILAFIIMVTAALVFWSLFFIGPMGMTLFIKQYVNKNIMGVTIPPQWFHNINTGIIVLGGPLLANWFNKKRENGADLSFPFLFSLALLSVGTAYIVLTLGIFISGENNMVSMLWVAISYVLQTIGELFLSPVGVAMIGKLAPQGKQGLLLGIWAMVTGIASMISKFLSQMMVMPNSNATHFSDIQSFSHVFSMIGWIAVFSGLLLFILVPFVKRLMGDEEGISSNLKGKLADI